MNEGDEYRDETDVDFGASKDGVSVSELYLVGLDLLDNLDVSRVRNISSLCG